MPEKHAVNCSRSVRWPHSRSAVYWAFQQGRPHPLSSAIMISINGVWQLLGVSQQMHDWIPTYSQVTPERDVGWETGASGARETPQMTADSARQVVSPASSSSASRKRSGYLNITGAHMPMRRHTLRLSGTLFVLVGDNLQDSDWSTGTCIHGYLTGALIQHSSKVRQHTRSLPVTVHACVSGLCDMRVIYCSVA